jgi:ActD protein
MAGKNTAVFGIYPSFQSMDSAVASLRDAGFRSTDVSVMYPENMGTKDFVHVKATKAPEGATTGGSTGAVLGGAAGWLAGIGALAIPGVGPFIAAGPIVSALAGAGVGGAVGGLTGGLVGLGIPEYEAKRYEGRVYKGGALLSVHADNSEWTSRAKKILEQTGAEDISSTGESKGDVDNSDRPMPRSSVL